METVRLRKIQQPSNLYDEAGELKDAGIWVNQQGEWSRCVT